MGKWRTFWGILAGFLSISQGLAAEPALPVGRLENTGTGETCTGVLVASDIVLTAAHCVGLLKRQPDNGPGGRAVFRLGTAPPSPIYETDLSVEHPLWRSSRGLGARAFRFDVGAVRLGEPVPAELVGPATPGVEASVGETLILVSWRKDDTARPRQRACPVVPGLTGLVTLGCVVRGGESGAPVFRKTESGLELVAILSSRGRLMRQEVAQASDVALRLPPLLDLLERAPTP